MYDAIVGRMCNADIAFANADLQRAWRRLVTAARGISEGSPDTMRRLAESVVVADETLTPNASRECVMVGFGVSLATMRARAVVAKREVMP
jgi:hypothetical protein